jgi:hypothetical protein
MFSCVTGHKGSSVSSHYGCTPPLLPTIPYPPAFRFHEMVGFVPRRKIPMIVISLPGLIQDFVLHQFYIFTVQINLQTMNVYEYNGKLKYFQKVKDGSNFHFTRRQPSIA